MKPTKIDLAIVARAKEISGGWITEDRWLKSSYFGYRYVVKGLGAADNLGCNRVSRLLGLGLIDITKIEGNYAYYKVVEPEK